MSVYENRFKKLLIEKDEEMSDDQTAMAQTLDKGTEVSDFDVQAPEAGAQAQPTMSAIQKVMYDELNTWILRLMLNQKILLLLPPNWIFGRIKL